MKKNVHTKAFQAERVLKRRQQSITIHVPGKQYTNIKSDMTGTQGEGRGKGDV